MTAQSGNSYVTVGWGPGLLGPTLAPNIGQSKCLPRTPAPPGLVVVWLAGALAGPGLGAAGLEPVAGQGPAFGPGAVVPVF